MVAWQCENQNQGLGGIAYQGLEVYLANYGLLNISIRSMVVCLGIIFSHLQSKSRGKDS